MEHTARSIDRFSEPERRDYEGWRMEDGVLRKTVLLSGEVERMILSNGRFFIFPSQYSSMRLHRA